MKIKAEKRDITGKKVKNLRSEGKVPASVYGPAQKPENLLVDASEILKTYREAGVNRLIDLEVEGSKGTTQVLIKELQEDTLQDEILHVSFYAVDPDKKLTAEIPVELEGVSPAVKNNIGFLVNPMDDLTVVCLPKNLPDKIVIKIDNLNEVGDSITLSDIKLPDGVDFPITMDKTTAIAYIAPPQKEIVEEEPEIEETEEGVEDEAAEEGEEGEKVVSEGEGEKGADTGEESGQKPKE